MQSRLHHEDIAVNLKVKGYKPLKLKCPLEECEAKIFWQWAQYHKIARDYLFSVPNGGSRNKIEAKNMKLTGTRKGVSDYVLAYPHNGKPGLFLELKRTNKIISKLTEEQAIWLARMREVGYATAVCHGADEAVYAVEEYLK